VGIGDKIRRVSSCPREKSRKGLELMLPLTKYARVSRLGRKCELSRPAIKIRLIRVTAIAASGHTRAVKSESGFISCLELPLPRLSARRPTTRERELLFTRRGACAAPWNADTPGRARQACPVVSETDYLRRVLGRLLTANTSRRASRACERYRGAISGSSLAIITRKFHSRHAAE